MKLSSLAELSAWLESMSTPPVRLEAERCVHAFSKQATCARCVQLCPVTAIHLDGTISLETEKCIACGACLNVCPTGAVAGEDELSKLLTIISRLPKGQAVDLVCRLHPAGAVAASASTAQTVLRLSHCLAVLGVSAYASMLLADCSRITARLELCAQCALRPLAAHIKQTVQAAQQVFADSAGQRIRFIETTEALTELPSTATAPVVKVKAPPVSRRDFFRSFLPSEPDASSEKTPTGNKATRPAVIPVSRTSFSRRDLLASLTAKPSRSSLPAPTPVKSSPGRTPPAERRRLLKVLQTTPSLWERPVPPLMGAVQLNLTDSCTACEVCVRVCPTSALESSRDQAQHFQLWFSPGKCTDCGVCVELCEPQAIHVIPLPTLRSLLEPEKVLLLTTPLRTCGKCGAKFAGQTSGTLCPVCEFRRRNPFGSRLPRQN